MANKSDISRRLKDADIDVQALAALTSTGGFTVIWTRVRDTSKAIITLLDDAGFDVHWTSADGMIMITISGTASKD